jgi:hypothetical protein
MISTRSPNLSAVRFTDFVSVPGDPSDKSLGYFQPSAKRGLRGADFLGKVAQFRKKENISASRRKARLAAAFGNLTVILAPAPEGLDNTTAHRRWRDSFSRHLA